jgi:hypothetical protein
MNIPSRETIHLIACQVSNHIVRQTSKLNACDHLIHGPRLKSLVFVLALKYPAVSSITVGDSCSTQGAILACTSDFTRFLYCAFGSSTVAEVDCLTQFPDCSHNELKNDVECPNSGDGYNVEKVDSNGNVIGFHNCVLFNIDGTSQDGVQSGCGF